MVVESVVVISIIIGAVAVATSALAGLAIFSAPTISSPGDKYPISEQEYKEHLQRNSGYLYGVRGGISPIFFQRRSFEL